MTIKLQTHYYQPMWTLVGAGIKNLKDTSRPMAKVMPKKVKWIKDKCIEIIPDQNRVRLSGASGTLKYEYLVVACGINIDWHKIKGLPEAFETPGVCSNYSANTVTKTLPAIQNFREGNAIFTFPNSPIKCAGAPQKIMYLTDAYFRQVCIQLF
jgi:sulfide:quinone oxidoreductase